MRTRQQACALLAVLVVMGSWHGVWAEDGPGIHGTFPPVQISNDGDVDEAGNVIVGQVLGGLVLQAPQQLALINNGTGGFNILTVGDPLLPAMNTPAVLVLSNMGTAFATANNNPAILFLAGWTNLLTPAGQVSELLAVPPTTGALTTYQVGLPLVARTGTKGDVNGDGVMDAVVGYTNQTVIYWRDPASLTTLLIASPQPVLLPAATGLALVDVDHDGDRDLVLTNGGISSGCLNFAVYANNGAGFFNEVPNAIPLAAKSRDCFRVKAADLNGDGNPDLIVSNIYGPQFGLTILIGNGNGTFSLPTVTVDGVATGTLGLIPLSQDTYGLDVGDVNGDGKPDLIVAPFAMGSNNTVVGMKRVWLNVTAPGSSTIALATGDMSALWLGTSATTPGLIPTLIPDMNGDARPELLVTRTDIMLSPEVLLFYSGATPPPPPTPPAAPSNLSAAAMSSTQINLAWTNNATTATSVRVERSLGGITFSEIAPNLAATSTTYSDTGLTGNTTYFYRVRACNAAGCSAYSNVAQATTPPVAAVPNAPSNVATQLLPVNNPNKIKVIWTDNSTNETSFTVDHATGPAGPFTFLANRSANTTYYNHQNPGAGMHCYRVKANNNAGSSPYSNTACTTFP